MSDGSDQDADLFVIEPVTQLDGTPVPQKGRLRPAPAPGRRGLPGGLALAEGLALFVCFLLPWFYFPDLDIGHANPEFRPQIDYSGWGTAQGVLIGRGVHLVLFIDLWLIPLVAAALLGLAWAQWCGLFSARLTLGAMVALSVLALLVVGGFYVQILLLKPALLSPGTEDLYGVLWGFCVTVVVIVLALVLAGSLLWRADWRRQALGD